MDGNAYSRRLDWWWCGVGALALGKKMVAGRLPDCLSGGAMLDDIGVRLMETRETFIKCGVAHFACAVAERSNSILHRRRKCGIFL